MYSQYNEDDKIFKFIDKKNTGTYIDIGAGKPKEISNTYMLYEMGWNGLLIEPSPNLVPDLQSQRTRDIVFAGALLNYSGVVQLFSKEVYGVTEKSYIYDTHIDRAIKDGFKEQYWTVPCITMMHLLNLYPQFIEADFVSIDVDGNEDAVLESCDFTIFKPKLILIEYILRGVDQRYRWSDFLAPYYDLVDTETSNAFYKRK